jgi:hypothetical protein
MGNSHPRDRNRDRNRDRDARSAEEAHPNLHDEGKQIPLNEGKYKFIDLFLRSLYNVIFWFIQWAPLHG